MSKNDQVVLIALAIAAAAIVVVYLVEPQTPRATPTPPPTQPDGLTNPRDDDPLGKTQGVPENYAG